MATPTQRARDRAAWQLTRRQHGVVAYRQLETLGFSVSAVKHRLRTGRLRRVYRGVYAVGRAELSGEGRWMAAVLACGDGAFLTHLSAGALHGICEERPGRIEVGVSCTHLVGPAEIRVRRRASLLGQDLGILNRIPVTSPLQTMIDLAAVQGPKTLLRSINGADKLDVIKADELREALEERAGQPGVRPLRTLLDRDTFVLSDEELERLFLPIARSAGLPLPKTKEIVNDFEVDFYWPDLGLVVETDGRRYHRTPLAQARDLERDQTHTAAGLTPLRFTHHQVRHEPGRVRAILESTRRRLEP